MQSIRNVTVFLIYTTLFFFMYFILALYFNLLDEISIAVIINLMTGFFSSTLISFVEYNTMINNNISYFIADLFLFYRRLFYLKNTINSSISISDKVEIINLEIKELNDLAKDKKQFIEIELLSNSKKSKHFANMIKNTYELTFGIELGLIKLKYISNNKKSIKNKKSYIYSIDEIIDAELEQIDINLKDLKKFNLYKNWTCLKKEIKLDEKK